jgi:Tir chaperone protein (CesT) family
MNNLNDVINKLKEKYGLTDLVADPTKVYRLQVNQKYVLSLCQAEDQPAFFLYVDLCPLSANKSEKLALFETVLQANLFGQETHDAYFAIDSARGMLLLLQKFKENSPEISNFEDAFQDFINCLNYWDQKLQEKLEKNPDSVADRPPLRSIKI